MRLVNNISELDLSSLVADQETEPMFCETCGGKLDYLGLGEYKCSKCERYAYNDYGKVRVFLEAHPDAKIIEIERSTGVTRHKINQMVNEGRFLLG